MEKLALIVGRCLIDYKSKIKPNEKYPINVDLYDYPEFVDYLDNSFIEKDEFNNLWFVTSNKTLVKTALKLHYYSGGWELVESITFPLIKNDICKRTTSPRSSTNFLIKELIDAGILVKVGTVHTPKPVSTYQPFFTKFFLVLSRKEGVLKFKLNQELIHKILLNESRRY